MPIKRSKVKLKRVVALIVLLIAGIAWQWASLDDGNILGQCRQLIPIKLLSDHWSYQWLSQRELFVLRDAGGGASEFRAYGHGFR
jgi:hypothetical protein